MNTQTKEQALKNLNEVVAPYKGYDHFRRACSQAGYDPENPEWASVNSINRAIRNFSRIPSGSTIHDVIWDAIDGAQELILMDKLLEWKLPVSDEWVNFILELHRKR